MNEPEGLRKEKSDENLNIIVESIREEVSAYYIEPEKEKANGNAIILIEEIWGINENIIDVANRLKDEGYIVLSPELLEETGITEKITLQHFRDVKASDENEKIEGQVKMRELLSPVRSPEFGKKTLEKLKACFNFLDKKENVKNIGVMGFCFGGGYSFILSINEPRIKACVSFYGKNPEPLSEIENLNCPVLAFYGMYDKPLIEKLPELVKEMEVHGKNFSNKIYAKSKHAFFNDKNPNTYNPEAAKDSWEATLEFFKKHLN
ncbi:MAG: dienelactone hydrolase family protein [Candidatus Pacearchaeota archaeon]